MINLTNCSYSLNGVFDIVFIGFFEIFAADHMFLTIPS